MIGTADEPPERRQQLLGRHGLDAKSKEGAQEDGGAIENGDRTRGGADGE